jgi:hypothetical protein
VERVGAHAEVEARVGDLSADAEDERAELAPGLGESAPAAPR